MNVQCFSPSTQQGPESFLLRGCGLLAVCGMSNHLTTGLETRSLNRPFLFLLVWCHHVKTGCCLQTQAAAEPSNSHKIRSPQGCCSSRAGRGQIRSNTGLQTLESPLPIRPASPAYEPAESQQTPSTTRSTTRSTRHVPSVYWSDVLIHAGWLGP